MSRRRQQALPRAPGHGPEPRKGTSVPAPHRRPAHHRGRSRQRRGAARHCCIAVARRGGPGRMRTNSRCLSALALAAFLLSCSSPTATGSGSGSEETATVAPPTQRDSEDWPRFLGPQGDGKSSEIGLDLQWPASGPRVVWTVDVGRGYSMPSVAGDRLFLFDRTGDRARLRCLDPETGEEHWRTEHPTDYKDLYSFSDGPKMTPVVDGRAGLHVRGRRHPALPAGRRRQAGLGGRHRGAVPRGAEFLRRRQHAAGGRRSSHRPGGRFARGQPGGAVRRGPGGWKRPGSVGTSAHSSAKLNW